MFAELKEVESIEQPIFYTCSCCSQEDNFSAYKPTTALLPYMIEQHVCYECAFWQNIIATPIYGQEVIDGYLFVIHSSTLRPLHVLNFSKGKEYYIRRKSDGELIKSNNVECKGKIPEHFREQLPDTADFLKLMDWQKLKNYPFPCVSRGCWDRYNCFRYDMSVEKDGAFNIIPPTHEVGSEPCPSFATKFKFVYE